MPAPMKGAVPPYFFFEADAFVAATGAAGAATRGRETSFGRVLPNEPA